MPAQEKNKIRVRMAPSPTGPLHLGTVRTTLFNWLFARHEGGSFILRIEDTDTERSDRKYETELMAGLSWLGINWDEGPDIGGKYGPYRQSERLTIYEKYLLKLLAEKKAYYCYCSKEDLEIERQAMLALGLAPRYSGKCSLLVSPPKDTSPQLIRFRISPERVEFEDSIRGKIEFDMSLTGDIVIAKNIKSPLYNFAVVVDDYLMEISHVVRGEEHIANTPKQILLQNALGFKSPIYAHLPLILNADRSKLSKRYVETSFLAYRDLGYLPDALINFIALLGWHPKGDEEILDRERLIEEFDLKRIQKAGAIFNEEKLNWLNSQYIKKTDDMDLVPIIKTYLEARGVDFDPEMLKKIIVLEKERIKTLHEFLEQIEFFLHLPTYNSKILSWKDTGKEMTEANLQKIRKLVKALPDTHDIKIIENSLMPLALEYGKGEILWPLRAALSGAATSPGPFEIMSVLGKDESLRRIDIALKKLR